MCVCSHPETHSPNSLCASFSIDSGFERLVQFPIAFDRQEPQHLRNSVDFRRQERLNLGRKIRCDQLIPTDWLVKKIQD
jgi:hypothetical protein